MSNIPLPDLKRSDDELGELGFGLQRDLDSEYGDYYSSFELDVGQRESNAWTSTVFCRILLTTVILTAFMDLLQKGKKQNLSQGKSKGKSVREQELISCQ